MSTANTAARHIRQTAEKSNAGLELSAAERANVDPVMFSRWLIIRYLTSVKQAEMLGYSPESMSSADALTGYREAIKSHTFDDEELRRVAQTIRSSAELIDGLAAVLRTEATALVDESARLQRSPLIDSHRANALVMEGFGRTHPDLAKRLPRGARPSEFVGLAQAFLERSLV